MLVTARVPKTTAMMRGTIINATRLRWSVEAIFSIERSSLWRRRWADFDRYAARSFVAQDNRTSPTPEAVAGAVAPSGLRHQRYLRAAASAISYRCAGRYRLLTNQGGAEPMG